MSEESKTESEENTTTDTNTSGKDEQLTKVLDELQVLRAENKSIKEQYKNIDPDEYFATKEALKAKERETAKSEDELKEIIAKQIREETQGELDKWRTKAETLETDYHRLTVVDASMMEIGPRFNDDVQDVIRDLVASNVSKDDDGLFIKDKEGKPRYKASEPTKRMTVTDYAQEVAEKRPSLAKSDWKGGARTGGEKSSASNMQDSVKVPDGVRNGTWPQAEQQKWFEQNPNVRIAARLSGSGASSASAKD